MSKLSNKASIMLPVGGNNFEIPIARLVWRACSDKADFSFFVKKDCLLVLSLKVNETGILFSYTYLFGSLYKGWNREGRFVALSIS